MDAAQDRRAASGVATRQRHKATWACSPLTHHASAIGDLGPVGDFLLRRRERLLVGEEVAAEDAGRLVALDRLEVVVELVHERDAGRDLEAGDVLVADAV